MQNKSTHFRHLWQLLQRNRPISYSSNLAHIVKSVKAAILLSQMMYWSKKGVEVKANDGWFRKQADHWTIETGLTRHEQDTARKLLVTLGFLEVQHKIQSGKKAHGEVRYRLNLAAIGHALADLIGAQLEAMNPLNLDDLQSGSEIVRQLLGKHVSYHRALVDVSGNTTAALLLSRMIYLQQRAFSANGGEWFSVTVEFYRQELGMNRRQQESARKALLQKNLIVEALQEDEVQHNRRLYQQVNTSALMPELEKVIAAKSVSAERNENSGGSKTTPKYKSGNLVATSQVRNRQPRKVDGRQNFTSEVGENVLGSSPKTSPNAKDRSTRIEGQEATTNTTTPTTTPANTGVPGPSTIPTAIQQAQESPADATDEFGSLFVPKGITGQELKDFKKWVSNALPHRRQLLIDEFEYQRKRRVITSPVGYIRTLVQRDLAANGEMPLEGAYGIARSREAEAKLHAAIQTPVATPTEVGIQARQEALQAARAALKSRGRPV